MSIANKLWQSDISRNSRMKGKERNGEVISAARISVQPEKRKELLLTITSLLDRIRGEEGCRSYRFYGEANEDDSFLLVGEWETSTDLDRHLQSENFAVLRGSVGLLGRGETLDLKVLTHVRSIAAFEEMQTNNTGA